MTILLKYRTLQEYVPKDSKAIKSFAFFVRTSLSLDIDWVLVDEVQKAPFLLDEVHRQIELNKKRKFALTGSSTRKLRRGKANLLAGRAYVYHLHPLTIQELGDRFDLDQSLQYGTLPEIFSSEDHQQKQAFLKTYAQTYLQEEVPSQVLFF